MNTKSMLVTPELAEEWLKLNTGNRPVRSTHVRFLTREIKEGRWKKTHQGIAFSGGTEKFPRRLIDGQHRLLAVIAANKAVEMMVTTGLDAEAYSVIDAQNARRSLADVTGFSKELVTQLRMIIQWCEPAAKDLIGSEDLVLMNRVFGDALSNFDSRHGKLTPAGVCCVFAVRLLQEEERGNELIEWHGLLKNKRFERMPNNIAILARRLIDLESGSFHQRNESALLAWLATKPHAQTLTKLQISDRARTQEEIRDAVCKIVKAGGAA